MAVKMKRVTVQEKMLQVLSDGNRHSRQELHACLHDDLGPLSSIRPHITALRKRLRRQGDDIVCELAKGIYYRWVILLPAHRTRKIVL